MAPTLPYAARITHRPRKRFGIRPATADTVESAPVCSDSTERGREPSPRPGRGTVYAARPGRTVGWAWAHPDGRAGGGDSRGGSALESPGYRSTPTTRAQPPADIVPVRCVPAESK